MRQITRLLILLSLLFILSSFSIHANEIVANPQPDADIMANYGELPLYFERNLGQTDSQAQYLAKTSAYTLFLTSERMVFNLAVDSPQAPEVDTDSLVNDTISESSTSQQYGLYVDFVGANPNPRLEGQHLQDGVSSYFMGDDASKWVSAVPHYSEVHYEALYEGIDAIFYGNQQTLQYDFIVAPYADPTQIQLQINPAERVEIADNGDLHLHIGDLIFTMQAPYSYQTINGTEQEIASEFRLDDAGMVGFTLGEYDPSQTLIIDPLVYSSYLGGTSNDYGRSIAVDGAGNTYVTGNIFSSDFPTTTGAFDTTANGNSDVFVTKLNADGTALVYSSYLGGTSTDRGYGIAVDSAGNAYITGETISSDFPTTVGAFDTTFNGVNDAFMTKLNASGTALVYSSYLGGTGNDSGRSIAIDSAGNAYITGGSPSSDFPTTAGAFDTTFNGVNDAFVTKLNASGTALVYSSYLGGTDIDFGLSIAVDNTGNAYIMGETYSSDFPTTAGVFQTTLNGIGDAFVTKLNVDGTALVYSSYLGGTNQDFGYGIAVDDTGNAYITGYTPSSDFPTTAGAFDTTFNGINDAFVTKLNASGTALLYSSYLGGTGNDFGYGIAVDSAGNAYVTGATTLSDFPTTVGAFDTTSNGSTDAFVTKLNTNGTTLVYSSYLGGTSSDRGYGIVVDDTGNAYIMGATTSSDFPTTAGAFDTTANGNSDVFVAKISIEASLSVELSVASANINEGNAGTIASGLNLLVSGGVTTTARTIDITLTDVSTSAGDYSQTNATVTIPAGDYTTPQTITIPTVAFGIVGDNTVELDEIVTVGLSNPSANAVIGDANGDTVTQTTSTFTITNDDTANITINDVSQAESSSPQFFTVSLSNPVDRTVTLQADTADNTAVAPDYSTISGQTITFLAGQTTQIISVSFLNDTAVELDETYFVNLSSLNAGGANVSIGDSQGEGTILNDESATVTIVDVSQSESGGNHIFNIFLSRPVDVPVTLQVDTADNTAISGADYTPVTAQTVIFPANNTFQTVTVAITDDAIAEADETYFVDLTAISASGRDVTFGDAQGQGTITNDDIAGITVAAVSGNVDEDNTATVASFTLTADTAPTQSVNVPISADAQCEVDTGSGFGNSGTLVLPANSTASQTVSVRAVNDATAETASHTCAITTGDPSSTDGSYDALIATDVADTSVTVLDNDITFTVTNSGAINEGTGANPTVTYTITPNAGGGIVNVAGSVTVTVTDTTTTTDGTDFAAALPSASVVNFAQGSGAQTVTVEIVADSINEPDFSLQLTSSASTAGSNGTATVTGLPSNIAISDDDNGSITVSAVTGTVDEDNTATVATFTLTADTAPTQSVNVPISADAQCEVNTGSGFGSSGTLVLPASSTAAQTVSVRAVNDTTAETASHACVITTGDPSSTDGSYDALIATDVADTSVMVLDNDITFTVTNSGAINEGTGANPTVTYTITPNSGGGIVNVGGSVTVSVIDSTSTTTASDFAATLPSASVVNFAQGSGAQTVTIEVVADDVEEADFNLQLTSSASTAGSNGSATVTGLPSNVAITDDDTAGITVTPSGDIAVDEGDLANTATYTVQLDTTPTGAVVIDVSTDGQCTISSPFSGTSGELTFTDTTAQTVTIIAVDDALAETSPHNCVITQTIDTTNTLDTIYDAINPDDVTITVVDDENAMVAVDITGLVAVAEDDVATTTSFTITASTPPTDTVSIPLTTDGQCSVNPTTVTLPSASTVAQTVTVTAIDDATLETASHTCVITTGDPSSTGDAVYDALIATDVADVDVDIADNDLNFTTTSSDGNEGTGGTQSYTVEVAPSVAIANVGASLDIALAGSGVLVTDFNFDASTDISGTGVSVVGSTISFAQNSDPAILTFNMVTDAIAESDFTIDVVFSNPTSGSSGTATINTLATTTDTLTITDDDTVGISVTESAGSTAIFEGGAGDSYEVVLNTQPLDTVEITVTPDAQCDLGAGASNPITLSYSTTDWNIAQTVPVSAIDDGTIEGPHTCVITHTVTSVGDASYNGFVVSDLNANVSDNDIAGITILTTAGTTETTEGGSSDSYTIQLNTQPIGGNDVTVNFALNAECTIVGGNTVTILNADYATPITVEVQAVDDTIADGNLACDVTQTFSSADPAYDGGAIPVTLDGATLVSPYIVPIVAIDNDVPGFSISALSLTEGASGTYSIVLNTAPAVGETVQITAITPDAQCQIVGATLPLVFDDTTWNIPQTVTVEAIDDTIVEGNHTCVITHAITSTNANYAVLPAPELIALISDNDVAPAPVDEPAPADEPVSADTIVPTSDDNNEPNLANDPAAWDIQITTNPAFASNGEPITFTITVRKLIGGTPVQVDFPIPADFTITSATSNRGAVSVSGNNVSYVDDIHVGDVGIITIETLGNTVQSNVVEACITVPVSKCARLTLNSVQALPATGEQPWWRNWLLAVSLLAGLGLAGSITYLQRQSR